MTHAVLVEGLQKSFGARRVLSGFDLQVRAGEFLGLVGPNGAGKSTLLRILIGLSRRDAGTCRVFGFDPATDSLPIRRQCSYLPGETSVYLQMTGRQFVRFAQSFHTAHGEAVERRLAELFALPLDAKVRTYSAGMKQKLAILATLTVDVDLYLLDEPDRALDASMRAELRVVLRELASRGKTVFLSSHHLEELQALATRLCFLREGSLVPDAEVEAARTALSRRLRLRLAPGAALPAGARLLRRDGDGSLVLEADGDPQLVVRSLLPGAVVSAETGVLRLEDLYERLFLPHAEANS